MSNTFFVFLPSNVTDYPDNQPNKFRVRLPKPVQFNGSWVCGLHSISYPYSWHTTIGTLDEQWIDIHFTDNNAIMVEQLRDFLAAVLEQQSQIIETKGIHLRSPSSPDRRKRADTVIASTS
uniref:Uncharacterized protein n=1 Tax=Globodera rostochiensis TaxID=31243 RepID=A0A914IHL4_GLORO